MSAAAPPDDAQKAEAQREPGDSILTLQQLIALERPASKNKRIVMDCTTTKYEIIKQVANEHFGWSVHTSSCAQSEWHLCWTDTYIEDDEVRRMSPYQKINHFPGSYYLGKKNLLCRCLNRLRKCFPEEYNFYPRSWLLPYQYEELRSFAENHKKTIFIVKPEASCQGRGIFLTKYIESQLTSSDHYVVQEYIRQPLLLEGLKFDLRIYVLVKSFTPLKIFLYREGLARFSTKRYEKPGKKNLSTLQMHLTNYSVNKRSPDYIFNQEVNEDHLGHKRSLSSILKQLAAANKDVDQLMLEIKKVILKTLCSVQPYISQLYRASRPKEDILGEMCFELFGFDILIDENLKPWLIEVNHTPSFQCDTPLDHEIKKHLLTDTLTLLNIKNKNKMLYQEQKQKALNLFKMQKVQKISKSKIDRENTKRQRVSEYEERNLNGFWKIYPFKNDQETDNTYEKYIAKSQFFLDEFVGVLQKKQQLQCPASTSVSTVLASSTAQQLAIPANGSKVPLSGFMGDSSVAVPGTPSAGNDVAIRHHQRTLTAATVQPARSHHEQYQSTIFNNSGTSSCTIVQNKNMCRPQTSNERDLNSTATINEQNPRSQSNCNTPQLLMVRRGYQNGGNLAQLPRRKFLHQQQEQKQVLEAQLVVFDKYSVLEQYQFKFNPSDEKIDAQTNSKKQLPGGKHVIGQLVPVPTSITKLPINNLQPPYNLAAAQLQLMSLSYTQDLALAASKKFIVRPNVPFTKEAVVARPSACNQNHQQLQKQQQLTNNTSFNNLNKSTASVDKLLLIEDQINTGTPNINLPGIIDHEGDRAGAREEQQAGQIASTTTNFFLPHQQATPKQLKMAKQQFIHNLTMRQFQRRNYGENVANNAESYNFSTGNSADPTTHTKNLRIVGARRQTHTQNFSTGRQRKGGVEQQQQQRSFYPSPQFQQYPLLQENADSLLRINHHQQQFYLQQEPSQATSSSTTGAALNSSFYAASQTRDGLALSKNIDKQRNAIVQLLNDSILQRTRDQRVKQKIYNMNAAIGKKRALTLSDEKTQQFFRRIKQYSE